MKIEENAFQNNQLTNIIISNSVTNIGQAAFNDNQLADKDAFIYRRNDDGTENKRVIVSYGGAKRENVIIPDGIIGIGHNAFAQNQLTSVKIPNTITEIGRCAFCNNQLQNIEVPSSVTRIWSDAFSYNKETMKAIVNNKEGSISGSPWGAASVEWTG